MKQKLLPVLILLLASVPLLYWGYNVAYFKWFGPQLVVGDPMPEFTVKDMKDQSVSSSELHQKVGVILFFAPWCPSCRQELLSVENELWGRFGKHSEIKIMVIGRETSIDTLNAFVKQNRYTFPVYSDEGRRAYRRFARSIIPRAYVIEKNGKIIWSSKGYNEDQFAEMMRVIQMSLQP